jgi:hypothetical protein
LVRVKRVPQIKQDSLQPAKPFLWKTLILNSGQKLTPRRCGLRYAYFAGMSESLQGKKGLTPEQVERMHRLRLEFLESRMRRVRLIQSLHC